MEYKGYRIPVEEFDAEIKVPHALEIAIDLEVDQDTPLSDLIKNLNEKGFDFDNLYFRDDSAYGCYLVALKKPDEQYCARFSDFKEKSKLHFIQRCKNIIDNATSPGDCTVLRKGEVLDALKLHDIMLGYFNYYKCEVQYCAKVND